MSYMRDLDHMQKQVRNKQCPSCGAKTVGDDIQKCTATGGYSWVCMKCNCKFHLAEYYPTAYPEKCPNCNSDSISAFH